MAFKKISKKEGLLCEKIFMIHMSIAFLEQGRKPFHQEALSVLRREVKRLKGEDVNK